MSDATCRRLLDELDVYVDGTAAAAICTEIEQHLAACEDCRVVVDTLRKTITLYRELPRSALPEAARRRLYQALDLSEYHIASPPGGGA